MADAATLAVYARAARDYAQGMPLAPEPDYSPDIAAFLAPLPPRARILDLGCGPGTWAAQFAQMGHEVSACDPCPEMAALARTRTGIDVAEMGAEELEARAAYDGIWANFSLLHLPRAALPEALRRIHRALRPKGMLHLGMKLGHDAGRDALGRYVTYYSEADLTDLTQAAGFTALRSRRGNRHDRPGVADTFVIVTAHG